MRIRVKQQEIWLFLFFIGYWMRYFTNLNVVYSLSVFSIAAVGTLQMILLLKYNLFVRRLYLRMILIDSLACFAIFINANHSIGDLVLLVTWECMGFLIFLQMKDPVFLRGLSTVTGFYIIIVVLWKYLMTDAISVSVSARAGENTISVLLILFTGLDILICETSKEKFNYVFYILAVVAVILAGGVAGIMIMCCFIFGIYFFKNRNNISKTIKYTVLLLIIGFVLITGRQVINEIISFVQSGDWKQRVAMLQTYWAMTTDNTSKILFGVNIENNAFLFHYRNLHNTFFNWHYYFGLIPCLYFSWITIKDTVFLAKNKLLLFLIFDVVMITRALTDETSYAYMMIWISMYCMIEERKASMTGYKEGCLNDGIDVSIKTI